ncbi:hypothetical protein KEM56_007662 [Ascosphaera pollenicola]|nr:hypothetical protein KEM56_007662 [Ascosphaera pollenicola]
MPLSSSAAILAVACLAASSAHASIEEPKVLPKPPMGFNNWARYQCNLNQTLFTETADAMASRGLLKAGYDWINLDDCWMADARLKNGSLTWNTTTFPDGIPWLGQYVKSKGFRFGIYEDAGTATCSGLPGSLHSEEIDANDFLAWGIEYLKLDACNVPDKKGLTSEQYYKEIYSKWHDVLSNLDPPMIFSESAPAYFINTKNETDWYTIMNWVPEYGELARHSYDVVNFAVQNSPAWTSIMTNYKFNTFLARLQKPGYINDPDFLIVDHPTLSLDERKSQFALWCSLGAPLILSADIAGLTDEEIKFLTNKDLIDVDQDDSGLQATFASKDANTDVLTRSLANGDRLVTILNQGDSQKTITVPLRRLGLRSDKSYHAKDLWTGDSAKLRGSIIVDLAKHATAVFRITVPKGHDEILPTGIIFNTASENCLTASANGSVSTSKCDGSDRQIWQATKDGKLSILLAADRCLETSDDGSIKLSSCSDEAQHKWTFFASGNIINEKSGACLTESGTSRCGFFLDSQVFEMPSGVTVHPNK